MSKPIAVHADGTNCYTKNCKLRNASVDPVSAFSAKLDEVDEGYVGKVFAEATANLASIYVEPTTAGFVNADGVQEKINFLAGTVAGGKALKAGLKNAESELEAFKKANYRNYSDQAGREGRVARLRVGAWKRGLLLHEDRLHPENRLYKLYYSTPSGFDEFETANDVEQTIRVNTTAMYTMAWGSDRLEITGVRESAKGERSLVFSSQNEEMCLYLGEYEVDGRWETDLAPLLFVK